MARSAIGLLACLAACSCSSEPELGELPNVLLISVDSVRADDLTFLDERAAPNLAALAERGTIFTSAFSGTSWTLPSHAQMFTGQPPSLHRVENDDVAIDGRTPTLPELLARAGYHTAGAWTGWYVAPEFGFARGFRSYRNGMTGGDELDRRFEELRSTGSKEGVFEFIGERDKKGHQDITSPRVAQLCREAIAEAPDDRPVFLFAHLFDPHYDYVPPQRWIDVFDPDYEGTIDGKDFWTNPRILDAQGKRAVSDRDLDHIRALYRGEIGWTDENIGLILDALREDGRLDETLVIVVADHGEEFFDHGRRGHRQTLYDEVLKIPMLVVPPASAVASGGAAPSKVASQVELSDVLPTILDYAGIEAPKSVWGRSLRPAVEGEDIGDRAVVGSLFQVIPLQSSFRRRMTEVLRLPDAKFLRVFEFDSGGTPRAVTVGHVDLTADPGELRWTLGLTEDDGTPIPRTIELWNRLEAEIGRMRELHGKLEHQPDHLRRSDLYQHVAAEMEALGYAGAAEGGSYSLLMPWGLGVRDEIPIPR